MGENGLVSGVERLAGAAEPFDLERFFRFSLVQNKRRDVREFIAGKDLFHLLELLGREDVQFRRHSSVPRLQGDEKVLEDAGQAALLPDAVLVDEDVAEGEVEAAPDKEAIVVG